MHWAKKHTRRDENRLSFGIWCHLHQRFYSTKLLTMAFETLWALVKRLYGFHSHTDPKQIHANTYACQFISKHWLRTIHVDRCNLLGKPISTSYIQQNSYLISLSYWKWWWFDNFLRLMLYISMQHKQKGLTLSRNRFEMIPFLHFSDALTKLCMLLLYKSDTCLLLRKLRFIKDW